MDRRQKIICAGALYANGYKFEEIAEALGVDTQQATELAGDASDAQATGQIGHMKTHEPDTSR